MIDLNLYRFRVGVYNCRSRSSRVKNTGNYGPKLASFNIFYICCLILYIYYIIYILIVTMAIVLHSDGLSQWCFSPMLSNNEFLHFHMSNVKLLSDNLLLFLFTRHLKLYKSIELEMKDTSIHF